VSPPALTRKSISIAPDELYGGQTSHEKPFRVSGAGKRDHWRTRIEIEKAVLLCLARPLAQRKYLANLSSDDCGGAIDDPALDPAFDEPRVWSAQIRFFLSLKGASCHETGMCQRLPP